MSTADAANSKSIDVRTGMLFIGGAWRKTETGAYIDVFDPSTESKIASVGDASKVDGIAAVDAAHAAAKEWAKTAPRERADILMRAYHEMVRRSDHLAELISRENGKALKDARGEVAYAAEFFRWYAEEAVRIIGSVSHAPSGNNRILVQHQPIGVSVLVTPWNFPAAMATRKIAPALAAGCTCILKPATETPLTAYAVADILMQAGVPDGVVNVITTSQSGAVVGAILRDPRVRKLSFTGSTEVGRVLLRQAADQVVKCSMELGGNAPFLVFNDADIDAAVDGAMVAKMRNGGEACTAANRFYVQNGVLAEFTTKLAARMREIKLGPAYDSSTDLGPLINRKARDEIVRLVEDAVARGAKVVTGGNIPDRAGFFLEPAVVSNVPEEAEMLRSEIFGPVAPVMSFEDEDEAIRRANDTEYGLVSYVYTGDLARGLRVSELIESGMVALNRGLVSDAAAPFGGMKQSGIGREGGQVGLLEYTEVKYIATAW